MYKNLLESFKLNEVLSLQNKIVFAPTTRCFADDDLCATKEMSKYYERRADVGLIISEATLISKLAQGYPNQPGIFTKEQINSWKEVNEKIHKKGALSFCQVFHAGRVSHKFFHDQIPVAPSNSIYEGKVPRTNLLYEEVRELSLEEIEDIIQEFVKASLNAIKAGFDGVELHCANGYLPDQFLHQETNKREDSYGGTIKNRANFVLNLVDKVSEAIGSKRVGIRLSPHAYLHMNHTIGDEWTFIHLLNKLEKKDIAYVHSGVVDDKEFIDYLDGNVSTFLRRYYKGVLISNGSYTLEEGNELIKENKTELMSYSRVFVANSDLVEKLKNNQEINEYDNSLLDELK